MTSNDFEEIDIKNFASKKTNEVKRIKRMLEAPSWISFALVQRNSFLAKVFKLELLLLFFQEKRRLKIIAVSLQFMGEANTFILLIQMKRIFIILIF